MAPVSEAKEEGTEEAKKGTKDLFLILADS